MPQFQRLLAVTILSSVLASGQWIKLTLPDTPRSADGSPDLTAPTPKTADGKPDLTGIWGRRVPVLVRTDLRTGRSGRWVFLPEDQVPIQPWARALWEKRFEVDLGAGRPSERCLPHTVPDSLLFGPFKLVQTPKLTIILEEEFNYYRQIHTDGRTHPEDPNPAWFGYSVGRWEGDTLVVDTRGFKIGSWLEYGWFDDTGIPYSESLHVEERFRRIDYGHLHLDVTVEDPKVFTRPWTYAVEFDLRPDTELIEDICENERDLEHMRR